MKFLKATIPALLAVLSVGFTACSDDDDYTPGAQEPGAFFSEDLPSSMLIPVDGHSFDITVNRTGADAPATYEVSCEDPSGLFTVPGSVTFSGDALETALTIGYDPEKVVLGQQYPLVLTLKGGSAYGEDTYSVIVRRANPSVTIPFPDGHNTGTYLYTQLFKNVVDEGMPVTVTYDPAAPTKDIVVNFGNAKNLWCKAPSSGLPGIVLQITIPDGNARLDNGCIPVRVFPQPVGVINNEDPTSIMDYSAFWDMCERPDNAAATVNNSYYDPETGTFTLDVIYALTEPDDIGYSFGHGTEFIYLDGFPDYEVDLTYKGTFTDTAKQTFAVSEVYTGADVANFITAMVPGTNVKNALSAVINGTVETQEFKGSESTTVTYPVSENGSYVLIAVSLNSKAEPQDYDYEVIKINLGGSTAEQIGEGVMIDGWIIPAYKLTMGGQPITANDLPFKVSMARSTDDSKVFILQNTYGEGFPLTASGFNTMTTKRDIKFTVDGTFITLEPQLTGYDDGESGEWTIANYEGNLVANNPNVSQATIINFMASNGLGRTSIEDGIMEIPEPLFNYPAIGDNKMHSWSNVIPTVLLFPEGTQSAAGKAIAQKARAARKASFTAKPKVAGISSLYNAAKLYNNNLHKLNGKIPVVTLKRQKVTKL